jgi:Amidohydrolase
MPVMIATSGHEPAIKTVLERNPDLFLIVDHLSLSDNTARQGRIPEVISQVVGWAKYPNVCAKMSSVPHKSEQSYPFRDMTEHLKRVFDAYGPRRCFWGTDLARRHRPLPGLHLPAAHHPLHRGAAVPVRGRQDGPRHHAQAELREP